MAKAGIAKKKRAFTLIELLVVCSILAMMAGVVLPSVTVFTRRNRVEQFVHQTSLLFREVFERSIVTNRIFMINLEQGRLTASYLEDGRVIEVEDYLLRAVEVPEGVSIDWPEKGWRTLPQGYCESPLLRFSDINTIEKQTYRVRPYDASLVRESVQ